MEQPDRYVLKTIEDLHKLPTEKFDLAWKELGATIKLSKQLIDLGLNEVPKELVWVDDDKGEIRLVLREENESRD